MTSGCNDSCSVVSLWVAILLCYLIFREYYQLISCDIIGSICFRTMKILISHVFFFSVEKSCFN
jgi:hypothetical protein